MTNLEKEYSRWPKSFMWKKQPNPRIEDDYIVANMTSYADKNVYCPANHRSTILSDVLKIFDEQSALEFVRKWGILGLGSYGKSYAHLKSGIENIFDYLLHKEANKNNEEILDHIITDYLKTNSDIEIKEGLSNYEVGLRINLGEQEYTINFKGDHVEHILEFAEKIRRISEIKYLLNLFNDDPYIAEIETEEWFKNNNSFFSEAEKVLFAENIPYQLKAESKLASLRKQFSSIMNKNMYIELTPLGHPVIKFDGLWCFIEFNLLSEDKDPILTPLKCADERCTQLFFPNRKGQRYCPHPQFENKRSLCEQRHLKREKRKEKKKTRKE